MNDSTKMETFIAGINLLRGGNNSTREELYLAHRSPSLTRGAKLHSARTLSLSLSLIVAGFFVNGATDREIGQVDIASDRETNARHSAN